MIQLKCCCLCSTKVINTQVDTRTGHHNTRREKWPGTHKPRKEQENHQEAEEADWRCIVLLYGSPLPMNDIYKVTWNITSTTLAILAFSLTH